MVIDVDPELKRALYVALAMTGSTLKDWFVKQATRHCAAVAQPSLFLEPENPFPSNPSNEAPQNAPIPVSDSTELASRGAPEDHRHELPPQRRG